MRRSQLETVQTFLANPAHAAWPMHARIQRAIRQLIVDGALPTGHALPASRVLAKSLGVSRDTVETSYAQLHAEGFIDRVVGSGSFVAEATDFAPARRVPGRRAAGLPPELARRGTAIAGSGGVRELAARAFAPGIPETRTFPLALWERLHRQTLKQYGTRALVHGDPQGEEPLRRMIAEYVNLERGGRAGADQVLVLTSSQQAMTLCATVLLDAGDRVFLEDPIYPGARRAFEAAGVECAPIALDAHGMRVETLRAEAKAANAKSAKAAFLTPSHQYPTGATLSLERRLSLIDWSLKSKAWIIEDDYDSEFRYVGRPNACIQGLDPHDRTIYIGTFTKSMFPALRLAYMVLPPSLVQPFVTARTVLDGFTATIPQLVLARFIEGGHLGTYVRTMRAVYAERLELLLGELESRLKGIVAPRPPIGGLQMPCVLDEGFDETSSIAAARRAGIELMGLSRFYTAATPEPGWLMGFAAFAPDEIVAGVRTLAAAVKGARRS